MASFLDQAKDWVGMIGDFYLEKERISVGDRLALEPGRQWQQQGEYARPDGQTPTLPGYPQPTRAPSAPSGDHWGYLLPIAALATAAYFMLRR